MSATIWADVLDKLYDLAIVDTFIAAEIAAQRLLVYDGPVVNDLSKPSILTIGGIPKEGDESETTSEWTWSSMGRNGTNADVDDRFLVPCSVSTILGQADVRAARRTAITIYSAVAQMARSDVMSTALPQVMSCIPQMGSLTQSHTADGAECMLTFGVHVWTRI